MRLLAFGMLLMASFPVQAQLDSILALPDAHQVKALWDTYYPWKTRDSLWNITRLQQVQEECAHKCNKELTQQLWLIDISYRTIGLHRYEEFGIRRITEAIEEAEQKGWEGIAAECLVFRGKMYYDQSRYGPAFENVLGGYDKLKVLGFESHPYTMRHLSTIAEMYYQFGDYESAIRFAREALLMRYPWGDEAFNRFLMNTVGLCFQRIQQYDSAMHYFNKAYEVSLAVKDSSWAALALGNLGYIHFLKKDYEAAIPMLEFDFATNDRLGDRASSVNAALALAEIHLLQGNAEAAEKYISYSSRIVDRGNIRTLSSFYKNRYAISKLRGDHESAVGYIDTFLVYRDSLLKVNDAKILAQAKLKVEVEQHANQIRALEAKRDREILLRNGAVIFLLMTSIISGLWISRRNLKRKKEYELSLLQQKLTEDDLIAARRELSNFTRTLKEKNELLESFKAEIDKLQQEGVQQSDARTQYLRRLVNSSILTEDDWREFRQLFDKVYPGFFIRLKEKMPDLNPADIRLLALTKLQLSTRDMAAMLGIGPDAIKKSRQRLRKRIDLPEEGNLDELVEMI